MKLVSYQNFITAIVELRVGYLLSMAFVYILDALTAGVLMDVVNNRTVC